ncbi:hypothetical protein BJX96DRAFT_120737 [Aspergillus floccosus]
MAKLVLEFIGVLGHSEAFNGTGRHYYRRHGCMAYGVSYYHYLKRGFSVGELYGLAVRIIWVYTSLLLWRVCTLTSLR